MSRWSDGQKQLITLIFIFGVAIALCVGGILGAIWLTGGITRLANPPAPSPAPLDGVLITSVLPGSPAEEANLQPGHVLLRLNDDPVTTPEMLRLLLNNLTAGSEFTLLVRDEEGSLNMTTAVRAAEPPYLGVEIVDWPLPTPSPGIAPPEPTPTEPLMARLPVVSGVVEGSPAAAVDIQVGDIITAVNGNVVLNGEELLAEMTGKTPGESVTLTLRRGDETLLRTAVLAPHPDDAQQGFLGVEFQP